MQNYGTKIFKILLCIGVFAYLQYSDISRGAHTISSVTAGLSVAGVLYLIASMFGIILMLSGNYIIAIIATGALALFLAFKLDEVVLRISWLTEDSALTVLGVFGGGCMLRDILLVKRSLTLSGTVQEDVAHAEDDTTIMHNGGKPSAQAVLAFSNMLEEKWGRKPSYKEVMEYIDGLSTPRD